MWVFQNIDFCKIKGAGRDLISENFEPGSFDADP
jgi:hypothetical protein